MRFALRPLGLRVRGYEGGLAHGDLVELLCSELEALLAGLPLVKAALAADGFRGGFWFNSNYLHDRLQSEALAAYEPGEINFFNPLLFSQAILNSVPAVVNKRFGLRGYTASYPASYHYPLFSELAASAVDYGILVSALSLGECFCLQTILLERSIDGGLQTILTEKGEGQKKYDFAIDIFSDIGNNHYCYDWAMSDIAVEGFVSRANPLDEVILLADTEN